MQKFLVIMGARVIPIYEQVTWDSFMRENSMYVEG